MTGSAIALPLFAASGASAADSTTWDRVAECESGGSWSADTGNGHYGGLRLTQDDWDKYGGLDYASRPDLASRSQQIAVAEKMLADQGTAPWHTCALLTGLSKNSGDAVVDTGVGGSSASSPSSSSNSSDSDGSSYSAGLLNSSGSSGSSGSSASSGSSDSSSGATGSPSPSSSPTSNKGKSNKSDMSGSGVGSQKVGSSPTASSDASTKADNSDNSAQPSGSWSLVDTGALGNAPRPTSAAGEAATGAGKHRGAAADERTYTVRNGDTLASIADSLDLEGGWRALYEANRQAVGADPNHISPGQTLNLGTE